MLAVGLTSLGSPIPAGYWTKTITTALVEVLHQSCGIGCLRLSARLFFFCRVIQVQIDLLFGLNLHTIRNEIFF